MESFEIGPSNKSDTLDTMLVLSLFESDGAKKKIRLQKGYDFFQWCLTFQNSSQITAKIGKIAYKTYLNIFLGCKP